MEATQTDVANPQLTSQEDGTVDGIVNGIMDQLDGDPNVGGVAVARPAEKPATEPEAESESEAETPETDNEPDKFVIKWQGQDKEVTQDELLDLAQKGFDYTQKTQALANERNQLAPYQGLANLIKSDPTKANQIAAILTGQAQQAPLPEKPTFDDPIEQLKWETKQEAIAEIRKEMASQLTPLHRQAALNQVRATVQADPDYREIHQKIIDMVKAQPPAIQKTLYMQLDQDPSAYVETFQHFKNQKASTNTTTEPPRPVKKETRAPILDSGGVEAPTGIESKAKAERIAKQKAKALRSGDPSEIAKWLSGSGAIDHLL